MTREMSHFIDYEMAHNHSKNPYLMKLFQFHKIQSSPQRRPFTEGKSVPRRRMSIQALVYNKCRFKTSGRTTLFYIEPKFEIT